ncbi:MAG TPA: extracellular solute-binding protein, partial [Methylomirabilota bacterium]|nr:extracellular solute-binding protein [Methylomirabilota bacterium]
MSALRTRPLLAALALALLAACSGGGAPAIKVVIAEYSKDHTGPFWRALAEQYTKQTGTKVELQVVDWNTIDQQVSTMLQNNQPPDVLNLNSFSSYARDGLLYPADDVLSPSTRDDFLEAFARGGVWQGKLYGFPILASARAFFYNRTLFEKAGITAPPRTWDELLADARKVQALGGGVIGYALPLGPEEAQAEWSIWMWNNGGDWKDGERWAIDSDRNVRTLTFLADLANKHRVTQVNPGKTNRTDGAFQLFKDGKVGMVMGFSP